MNPAFDETLARVRARYLSRLPAYLRELKELLEGPDSDEERAAALRLAHRLKGSSGSYGLHGLSHALSALEAALGQGPSVPMVTLVGALVDAEAEALEGLVFRAEGAEVVTPISAAPKPSLAPIKAGRVLLLGMGPVLAQRCVGLLRQHPVEVVTCESLEYAVEVAAAGWLDFVLLRSTGPGSIAEAVRRLRVASSNHWLPVGAFSSEANLNQHQRAAAAGVDMFLSTTAPDGPIQEAFDQLFEHSRELAPKLLLVDDDPEVLTSLESILGTVGMRTHKLSEPTRVLEILDVWDPDALVLDVDMPELRGNEICSILRSSPRWQSLPVIMLTGSSDRATRLACFRAGCDDFIAKPFDPEELVVRIQARVTRKRVLMRSERDPLSGLILRRPFSLRSSMRASEARRHKLPLSFCMIDLDHFKRLNDEHGHLAGDRVIATLGRLLRSRLREEDLAARWGGEEFAVALPHTEAGAALHVISDVLAQLSTTPFVDDVGRAFSATFSAGIAAYPADGDSVETLLAAADARLYDAKREGRARVSTQPPRSD